MELSYSDESQVLEFVEKVLSSNIAQKKEVIHFMYTLKSGSVLNDESCLFFLKNARNINCTYKLVNDVIFPFGDKALVSQILASGYDYTGLPKLVKIIVETKDDWRRKMLSEHLVRALPDLEDFEQQEVYLDFIRHNGDPDQIYEVSLLKDNIPAELIAKVKFARKALGELSRKIPKHIKYFKNTCSESIIEFTGKVVAIEPPGSLRTEIHQRYQYDYETFYHDTMSPDFDELEVIHTDGTYYHYS